MGDGLVLQLLLLVALIIGSGLLSGAEAAYFSLGRARLRRIAAERPEGATAPVVSRPHDLLVTLLVGITVINIGASALATHVAHFVFGPRWGLLVELIGMVVLLTTFGEVLPMTLAVKYPDRFLALVERPVRWLEVLLAPIRGVLAGLTMLTVRLLGRGGEAQAALSEEELRTLVDVGAREGVVEREEREMIHKVFELEDTLVRSVMVPRTDMFCLDVETPAAEILPALREQLHSRVPVFEGSIDVIVGVLYTKDLLPYAKGLPPDFEELVGEISDEYDEPERLIQKIDARTYRVAGKLPVDDLNAATGLAISNEAYDTVGGWVLDLFGRVPRKGERMETPELSVTVEKVERTRVIEVVISLRTPQSTEAAA